MDDLTAIIVSGLFGFFSSLAVADRKPPPEPTAFVPPEAPKKPERSKRAHAPVVQKMDDLLSALVNMGYTRQEAGDAAQEARKQLPGAPFDGLLRRSLRLLARKFFE